jgi:hypothetical protein
MTEKTKENYEEKIKDIIDYVASVDFGDDWCQIKISSDRKLEGRQIIRLAKLLDTEDIDFTTKSHGCSTCGYGAEAIIDCTNCNFKEVFEPCEDCNCCGCCKTRHGD